MSGFCWSTEGPFVDCSVDRGGGVFYHLACSIDFSACIDFGDFRKESHYYDGWFGIFRGVTSGLAVAAEIYTCVS